MTKKLSQKHVPALNFWNFREQKWMMSVVSLDPDVNLWIQGSNRSLKQTTVSVKLLQTLVYVVSTEVKNAFTLVTDFVSKAFLYNKGSILRNVLFFGFFSGTYEHIFLLQASYKHFLLFNFSTLWS